MRTASGPTRLKTLLSGLLWGALGQGLLALGGRPAAAAPTATLGFTVSIADADPPSAVTDVAASSTVTPGQALLTWTAPDEDSGVLNGEAVQSYTVKYATFSVADLGGDAALWWSLASAAPSPPAVPQPPGGGEVMVVNLTPGTRYWFGVRSQDGSGNPSALDTTAPQANVLTRGLADATVPAPVAGFVVTRPSTGTYTLDWPPVTQNTDGTAATDIAGYRLYLSTGLFGPYTTFVSSVTGPAATGLPVSVNPLQDTFYVLRAVDASGNESPLGSSNYLYFSPTALLGQAGLAQDGTTSRALLPEGAIPELATPGGNYLLTVSSNTDPALNRDTPRILATYTVGLAGPTGTPAPAGVVFQNPVLSVSLQYGDLSGPVIDPARVGVLWWNGVAWVKVGQAQVNDLLKTVSFQTALPGVYQVRNFAVSGELSLDRTAVFPRVFSPNGDGYNDRVYFVVDNPRGSAVGGKIVDLSGGWVNTLAPAGAGAPTPDTLTWDGRDGSGHIVPAGVYIYRIDGEGKTFSGTVVVAK